MPRYLGETQTVIPGLEGYTCTFECLTHCPLAPDGGCFWDDPSIGAFDEIEYPEFFWWRENNGKLVRPEPKNPLQTRCPRCLSTKIVVSYLYIECRNCNYNESLMDFPCSRDQAPIKTRRGNKYGSPCPIPSHRIRHPGKT